MVTNNSPTLQNMINSVVPRDGNMPTVQDMTPGQFRQPYPSPKDMVMMSGMMNTMPGTVPGMYQPFVPMMGSPMAMGIPNMVVNINGIPTELEYRPEMVGDPTQQHVVNYINVPGAPTNPDLAHLAGKSEVIPTNPNQDRYVNVPNATPGFGQAMMARAAGSSPNIVGAYNPAYGQFSYGYGSGMPGMVQSSGSTTTLSIPTRQNRFVPGPMDVYGYLDIYDGQVIHPHVEHTMYGSPNYPFHSNTRESLKAIDQRDKIKEKFNEKFPGYSNPYAPMGFGMGSNNLITKEIMDMANVAAFYGMSYNQFITNGSNMMKKMSRHASRYFGRTDEEAARREKLYDVKYEKNPMNDIPENDTDLFYPNGAFGPDGQFTREYQGLFCISPRVKKAIKKLRVRIVCGDKVTELEPRPIDFAKSREMLDRAINASTQYNNWLMYNRYRFAEMYNNAPERKIDNIEGNAFEVTSTALAVAELKELEAKLLYQNRTRTSTMFNRDNFITSIRGIFNQNRENSNKIRSQKFSELVHRVAGNIPIDPQMGISNGKHYIIDGDWVIAEPGYDVAGFPLEQSVNKIVRLNTATGEEEVYNPAKLTGLDIRERIIESNKARFTNLDDDELSRRLEMFEREGFEMPPFKIG